MSWSWTIFFNKMNKKIADNSIVLSMQLTYMLQDILAKNVSIMTSIIIFYSVSLKL